MLAIRAVDIGREFVPPLALNNPDPQLAMQLTLAIMGFNVTPTNRHGIRTATHTGGMSLSGISFEIPKGSVTCLQGASGSGKSVLLRILSGALAPTTGRAEIHGRVSSLLDVEESLENELSAMQIIEREQDFRATVGGNDPCSADEIIEFGGLRGFEDVDVGRFSSGMRLRLGISIALHSRAPILLVDDVLGVGDLSFQQQCVERLLRLKREGRTMMLVLSDERLMRQLADRVIELHAGRIVKDGPPEWVSGTNANCGERQIELHQSHLLPENDIIALKEFHVRVLESAGARDEVLELDIEWRLKTGGVRSRPLIEILRGNVPLFRSLAPRYVTYAEPQNIRYKVVLPLRDLPSGTYAIGISASSFHGQVPYSLKARGAIRLVISGGERHDDARSENDAYLTPPLSWDYDVFEEAADGH
jgi:ABC-type polysaccharide/polyol phosphate transport system ATPase subunit